MSIWCSRPHVGFDLYWEPDPDEDNPQGGQVRSYVDGWSNHYPTTDDTAERPAAVNTAHIAPWCTPGWEDREDECDGKAGPWLRLSIDAPDTHVEHHSPEVLRERAKAWERGERPETAVVVGEDLHVSVVLDEEAVHALIQDLIEWRDTPKTRPPDAGA